MIIGHKTTEIGNGKIRNIKCPHCLETTGMNYTLYSKFVHFYWIPFVPVQKIKILECTGCKATFDLKDLSPSINEIFQKEQERNPMKVPIRHFAGLFLIVALFVFFYFSNRKEKENVYLKHPKIGDVYQIKSSSEFFST